MPRLLFVVLLSVAGFAQTGDQVNVWIPRGPEGGVVGRPVVDPQNPGTLYAGAGRSVFKTTDSGIHWSEVSGTRMTLLAVDPQNPDALYGSFNGKLFKSTNAGSTWNEADTGLACPCQLTFAIDPSNPSTVYAGTSAYAPSTNGGVFKSTDGGATWRAAGSGLPVLQRADGSTASGIASLAIDPNNPGTLYAASILNLSVGGGVFKSTDGAATWSAVNVGLADTTSIVSLTIDPRNPNILYAVSPYGGPRAFSPTLFKTTDGASTWTAASTGFNALSLSIDPQDSNTLYALNDSPNNFDPIRGVFKSTDGGGTWNVVLLGGTGDGWVTATPSESGPSIVFAGIDGGGISKSVDGGRTWATANSGLVATSISSIATNPGQPGTLYAGIDRIGILRSTDGAKSWSANPVVSGPARLAIDPGNVDTLYSWNSTSDDVLSKSTDGGASWRQLLTRHDSPYGIAFLVIDSQNPDTLYAGPLKSIDGGATWGKFSLPTKQFTEEVPTALAIDSRNPGTFYVATNPGDVPVLPALSFHGRISKSVNAAASWSEVNPGYPGYATCCLYLDPNDSNVVYAQTTWLDCGWFTCFAGYFDRDSEYVRKGLGVFRSTDAGATWVKLDLPGDPFFSVVLGIDPQGTLYARTDAGLVRSKDRGTTWNPVVSTGLTSTVTVLAFDPQDANHLFAGTTDAGVFEITLE